ncbi:MAG: TonB-dependent receptor [Paludibacter sp.]|nr:TonB-dependent receptor [Paludibacter sp.]
MNKIFTLLIACLTVFSVFSQKTVKGIVVDKNTHESLVGVSVYNPETSAGVSTSLDGTFSFDLPEGIQNLTVSYVGYKTQIIEINTKKSTSLKVELENEAIGLNDLTVTSSVAVQRKTPVALSVVEPAQIELKLGTQEFPEILKTTPGVYATKQGGGYGDSRINLRGFASENIAVMVNGVPMNDMEWGGIYWSNWAGLSDVTRSMQVQRGLGASKVAAPSVGGSINIVTKSTEAKKGGTAYYGVGSDGMQKMAFSVSTGLVNGWAMTLMGAKTSGDGYVIGTQYEGYSYFLNVSKVINDNQQISFTGFGAPQWHNQRKDQLLISEWAKYGTRYNAGFGYDINGQQKTFNYNYYHKPQLSLNHFWTINDKSSLSTALYMSIGIGGGYGAIGSNRGDYYGSTGGIVNESYRKIDETFDFVKLEQENAESDTGSKIAIQNSINNHLWYGLLSTYNTTFMEKFQIQGGIDLRYYKGIHQAKVEDLLGGAFVIDPARATGKFYDNAQWRDEKLTVGDIVYRNYDGYVTQDGVFGQIEYNEGALSSFVAASANTNSYWKVDHFYYDNEKSDVATKLGFSVKGGANYNIDEHQNVFGNIGYFSRAPYFSGGIFLQATTSNLMNTDAHNEKVFSAEIGYGFRSKYLKANLNLYHTNWLDKTMIRSLDSTDPEKGTLNLTGVDSRHRGVEVDFTSNPVKNLEVTGMLSLGDWAWKNNASGYLYNQLGQPINTKGDVVDMESSEHAYVTINIDGIKVGNSAQTTANIGANYKFLKDFKVGVDYTYYARNYANYSVIINNWGVNNFQQPWEIPAVGVMDLFANYHFKIGEYKATLIGNVNNLLDQIYITDAEDGALHDSTTAQVYYGFGRTWSISLKLNF